MNLRARSKRLGLLTLAALVLFSCEEENTIGLPPEDNLGIFFAEISLKEAVSQIWIDDTESDLSNRLIAGSHEDPELGTITSVAYADLDPTAARNLIDPTEENTTYVFSSATMSLRIIDAYGNIDNTPDLTFGLYQLADTVDGNITYTNSSSIPLGEKIGEANFSYFRDSLGLEYSSVLDLDSTLFDVDSIYLYTADFELDQSFFRNIFNQYRAVLLDTVTYELADISRAFNDIVKGIAVVGESEGTSLIFDGGDIRSAIRISYIENDGSSDTTKTFAMITNRFKAFNEIAPNASESWTLGKFGPLTSFYTPTVLDDPNAYIQSGANLFLSIDFSPFRNFADTATNATVQKAQLFINSGEPLLDDRFDAVRQFLFQVTSDERLAENDFDVRPDVSFLGELPSGINFDRDSVNFIDMPTYLNQLILNRTNLDLVVVRGSVNSILSRVVIPKDSIFLRVFYSKAN